MEHCMSHFLNMKKKEELIVYITDALMIIAENTARFNGGRVMSRRYHEEEVEEMDSEDVIKRMKNKLEEVGNW